MKKKIILLGDSMIDTYDFMGQGFPELSQELTEIDATNMYELKNHGVGSTGVDLACERLHNSYEYIARGRSLHAVLDEQPDLVIVESCAYNHWSNSESDLRKYIEFHQKIVDTIQEKTKIVLLATIAPHESLFATGVQSLGWDMNKQTEEYQIVMNYLQTFISWAQKTKVPFVNVYKQSLMHNTGNEKYISNVDYIHYSFEGRKLVSKELAPVIAQVLK